MDTRSQHLLFDAVLEKEIKTSDIEVIKSIIEKHMTVVKRVEHKFDPFGETIVFILAESHFSIHTYPENNYISMDLYVCNTNTNVEKIAEEIKNSINFIKTDSRIVIRGKIGESVDAKNLNFIYFITAVVACCSIVYEFLLAQSLSTTMGNTALRYNLTIGLFIASMGFGALLYRKFISNEYFKEFIKVELLLSCVGGLAPALVLLVDYFFNAISKTSGISFFSSSIQFPLFIINHSFIVFIGFLSGLELPLLIDLSKQIKTTRGHYVLAFDYLGTLSGAILFPILILPNLHIFTIGYMVSLINVLISFVVMIKFNVEQIVYKRIIFVMLILWSLVLLNSSSLNQLIIGKFYFGGIQ